MMIADAGTPGRVRSQSGVPGSAAAPGAVQSHTARVTPLREDLVVLRLGTVVLGAQNVDRAAAFWADVFGYEVVTFPDAEDGFTILVPPDRVGTRIALHRTHTPPQE